MSIALLKDSLRPRYFISYSRKDLATLHDIKSQLGGDPSTVWHDLDQIHVGDDWMHEIERGIADCDEFILLLSNASLQSPVVLKELALAHALGKSIRPIRIAPIASLPEDLSSLHYLDLAQPQVNLARSLSGYLSIDQSSYLHLPTADLLAATKRNCVRTAWPRFGNTMLTPAGRERLTKMLSLLNPMLQRYPEASLLWMNAGLINCLLGAWLPGLQQLRSHAQARQSFAAWYMYALHLSQGKHVQSLKTNVGDEVMHAIHFAETHGENPLSLLVKYAYEFGFRNLHTSHLEAAVVRIHKADSLGAEDGSEYLRLFWALRDSLSVFREYRDHIVEFIKHRGMRDGQGA